MIKLHELVSNKGSIGKQFKNLVNFVGRLYKHHGLKVGNEEKNLGLAISVTPCFVQCAHSKRQVMID